MFDKASLDQVGYLQLYDSHAPTQCPFTDSNICYCNYCLRLFMLGDGWGNWDHQYNSANGYTDYVCSYQPTLPEQQWGGVSKPLIDEGEMPMVRSFNASGNFDPRYPNIRMLTVSIAEITEHYLGDGFFSTESRGVSSQEGNYAAHILPALPSILKTISPPPIPKWDGPDIFHPSTTAEEIFEHVKLQLGTSRVGWLEFDYHCLLHPPTNGKWNMIVFLAEDKKLHPDYNTLLGVRKRVAERLGKKKGIVYQVVIRPRIDLIPILSRSTWERGSALTRS